MAERGGVLLASRRISTGPGRDARRAGATPITSPTTIVTMTPTTTNGRPKGASSRGIDAPVDRTSKVCSQYASVIPATPPMVARRTLSVSIWRARRARPAPRATRTPISRRRQVARVNSRFATFAQTSNSTAAIAYDMRRSGVRTSPTICSSRGMAVNWRPLFVSG